MNLGLYILNDRIPIAVDDAQAWGAWFAEADRCVAHTKIGDVMICTDFLGVDHQYGDGPPLLFETMVFGGQYDQEMTRCSTWDEAEEQHRAMVYKITAMNDTLLA